MSVEARLNRIWYDDAAGRTVLMPLSWMYGRIVAARRHAFSAGRQHSTRVDRPVIVVGNLSVGGTGKTPLVAWLAWQLGALGKHVGIASRGYAAAGRRLQQVDSSADWRSFGDEPVLLQRRTGVPVVVDADRVAAARHLITLGADVVLCDDGLGFNPLFIKKGHGFQNMQKRANRIKAIFAIESSPGKGARYELKIPISEI